MIIKQLDLFPYELKLKNKFKNSKNIYLKKNGFIIKIVVDHYLGLGDVSYLQGFSKETLQEINWGFQSFKQAIGNNENYSFTELIELIEIHSLNLPSLQFGLDTAIHDIKSQQSNISISRLINTNSQDKIQLSTLYNNPLQNIKYYNCIKYKLGVRNIDDDIKILKKIIALTNHSIQFRFDANQAFTMKEFLVVYKKLKDFNIDYYEEPIQTPTSDKLKKLKEYYNLNIALDESLYQNKNYKSWVQKKLVDVLIIKPSILGGYKTFNNFHTFAEKNNLKMILSSALESSIGNMATIHLAATLNTMDAHGLNIHTFYDQFIDKPIYTDQQSIINLKNIVGLGLNNYYD